MISVKENRMMILEKNGSWVGYPKQVGFMHRDCLEDYADKKRLLNASAESIVNNDKCAIIYNLDDKAILGYLPKELTDDQLYQLDLFATMGLDDVEYMEVKKCSKEKEEFILDHDVSDRFSTEVIQSYYQAANKEDAKRR